MGPFVWGSNSGSLSGGMLSCPYHHSPGNLICSQEPCPSPMQASMLLERNPSLVPLKNIAKLEEKLGAQNCVALNE